MTDVMENGDETGALRQTVARQELIIDVLKARVFELEIDLINQRIAARTEQPIGVSQPAG